MHCVCLLLLLLVVVVVIRPPASWAVVRVEGGRWCWTSSWCSRSRSSSRWVGDRGGVQREGGEEVEAVSMFVMMGMPQELFVEFMQGLRYH